MALVFGGCDRRPEHGSRTVLAYWEKWTGSEADAMRAVVDDFNASQSRIFVDYSSISQIDHRLMLATAGGVPPDVAGVFARMLPVYSENNALTPLDTLAADAGIRREQYIDVFWRLCVHRGHLWALPSTPTSTALIWNKKMFREAGLDPEQPPRSLAEFEQFNEKLARRRPNGSLEAIGHLPLGWWDELWGAWFGGKLWDGDRKITTASPENLAAYRWVESYPRRFGAHELAAFRDGLGNFASPQNPFFTGRVAMVLQGVWIYTFIKNYAPADFEWGVAAFPSADPERLRDVTVVESDAFVIPAGAKHPKEAFEFIRYLNSQGPMEKLCLGQRKFTPLRAVSAEFLHRHPNPYIAKFIELARSPNAVAVPPLSTWTEYLSDMRVAVDRILAGESTAQDALTAVERREQEVFNRRQIRAQRAGPELAQRSAAP